MSRAGGGDWVRGAVWFSHQGVADLSQGDELLVAWCAHVEADGQQLLEGSHNEGGLHGVQLPLPPSAFALSVLAS